MYIYKLIYLILAVFFEWEKICQIIETGDEKRLQVNIFAKWPKLWFDGILTTHATYSTFHTFWCCIFISWPVLNFSMFSDWGKNMLEKHKHIWEETILIKTVDCFLVHVYDIYLEKNVLTLSLLEATIHFRARFRRRLYIDAIK